MDNTLIILNNKLKRAVSVHKDYDDLPNVTSYADELNQVWTNLIDNAADVLADQEDGKIIIRTREDNGRVFVEIEDNGPGIPAEHQSRIFDPFFTTRKKGTGLGLAIVHKIVENHHGEIFLESPPNDMKIGCRFTINIPVD